jgi:hypothetical protein
MKVTEQRHTTTIRCVFVLTLLLAAGSVQAILCCDGLCRDVAPARHMQVVAATKIQR